MFSCALPFAVLIMFMQPKLHCGFMQALMQEIALLQVNAIDVVQTPLVQNVL